MGTKLDYIDNFFKSHGWQKNQKLKHFDIYFPPKKLNLPDEFFLEIPKNQEDKGFSKYIEGIIGVLEDVYIRKYTHEDLLTFFSTDRSIFSLQIVDPDTKSGSIRLERLKNAFDNVFKSIKQAVVFVVSNKPIFGSAKNEVTQYLNFCRGKQTEFGSYIIKFDLPENHLTLLQERSIPNILFDTIDFLSFISEEIEVTDVDNNLINKYQDFINIELFEAIIKLYKEAEIQNVNFKLDSNKVAKEIYFENVRSKLGRLEITVKGIKDLLLKDVPLEARGTIFRLSSKEIEEKGKIWIEAEIAEEKQVIEVQLNSENYKKAVEAHWNGLDVYVKGVAKVLKSKYVIEDLQEFEVK